MPVKKRKIFQHEIYGLFVGVAVTVFVGVAVKSFLGVAVAVGRVTPLLGDPYGRGRRNPVSLGLQARAGGRLSERGRAVAEDEAVGEGGCARPAVSDRKRGALKKV